MVEMRKGLEEVEYIVSETEASNQLDLFEVLEQ